MVRVTGLEPVRHSTHAPQTCLSANSSTLAFICIVSPVTSDLIIIALNSMLVNRFFWYFLFFRYFSKSQSRQQKIRHSVQQFFTMWVILPLIVRIRLIIRLPLDKTNKKCYNQFNCDYQKRKGSDGCRWADFLRMSSDSSIIRYIHQKPNWNQR